MTGKIVLSFPKLGALISLGQISRNRPWRYSLPRGGRIIADPAGFWPENMGHRVLARKTAYFQKAKTNFWPKDDPRGPPRILADSVTLQNFGWRRILLNFNVQYEHGVWEPWDAGFSGSTGALQTRSTLKMGPFTPFPL